MSRQDSGNMRRCTSCTAKFVWKNRAGVKLVNGTECPTWEAAHKVMYLMDVIRAKGEATGV